MTPSHKAVPCCGCCQWPDQQWPTKLKARFSAPGDCCFDLVEVILEGSGNYWEAQLHYPESPCCQFLVAVDCDCKGYSMGYSFGAHHGFTGRLKTISCDPLRLEGEVVTYQGPGDPEHYCGCDFDVTVHVVVTEVDASAGGS